MPSSAPTSRAVRRTPAAARAPALDRVLARAAEKQAAVEVFVGESMRIAAAVVSVVAGVVRLRVLETGEPTVVPTAAAVRVVVHVDGRSWDLEADLSPVGDGAALGQPRRVRASQRRASARIPAAAGSTVLFAAGERVFRRPIIDLAASGLGVEFSGEADEPAAGTALGQLRFSLPIGAPIVAAAVVRHVRARADDGVQVAGLDLIGLRPEDARRLDAWVRGQTRTRKREEATRAQDLFSASSAVLHGPNGRSRSRAVVDVHPRGLVLGLEDGDRDLTPGERLKRVELWHDGACVIGAEAEVGEVVSHRARPLHAHLTWRSARAEDVARVTRLLRRLGR